MKKSRFFLALFVIASLFLVLGFASSADNSSNSTTANVTKTQTATTSTSSNTGTLPSSSGSTGSNSASGSAVEKGYTCLDNKIKNKNDLSLQEAIFSTLALGSRTNLQDRINSDKSSTESCWPKSACSIKESAQVLLAQKRSGKSTESIEKWLLSKNATSNDLNWYLEIDISNRAQSECTLKYDGSEKKIKILDTMQISGNPGNCFGLAQEGFWLIFRENCYDKDIQISCDQDFVSALLYQKKGGQTVYVLPNTHSASALGTTTEQVSVKCFKSGTSCDYEGSLWATLSLNKAGKKVDSFVPYLIALSDNNRKYFPSSFLYALTAAEDQYSDIVQSQKQGRSWKMIGTPYNEFYDTSLAMLALQKSSASELESAKNYFLSIQGQDGCWNNGNIRDTGFLLYSGWPKASLGGSSSGGGSLCEEISGQSCENSISCLDAGGRVLSNFECSGFNTCCSVSVQQQSCAQKNGLICAANQECQGSDVQSADGSCCIGSCVLRQEQFSCEFSGGTCRDSCLDNEDLDATQTCSPGMICCGEKQSSSSWTGLIIFLIILIILIVLAIVFRNKLKVWWFKFKGKAKVSPITRPGVPPSGAYRTQPSYRPAPSYAPRQVQRPMSRAPVRKPSSPKDKEMEDTLKKLREMSK